MPGYGLLNQEGKQSAVDLSWSGKEKNLNSIKMLSLKCCSNFLVLPLIGMWLSHWLALPWAGVLVLPNQKPAHLQQRPGAFQARSLQPHSRWNCIFAWEHQARIQTRTKFGHNDFQIGWSCLWWCLSVFWVCLPWCPRYPKRKGGTQKMVNEKHQPSASFQYLWPNIWSHKYQFQLGNQNWHWILNWTSLQSMKVEQKTPSWEFFRG